MLVYRSLLILAALIYGALPIWADLSDTHVFHADWPPHARFHMVWQLTILVISSLLTIIGAVLVKTRQVTIMKLLPLPGLIVLMAFFLTALSVNVFSGSLSDDPNARSIMGLDANVFVFSLAAFLQLLAAGLIWSRSHASKS